MTTTTNVASTISTCDNDLSQPTLSQHETNNLGTLSSEITATSEAVNGKVGTLTTNESTGIPSPIFESQVSFASTRVNASDITLAVEDPFAITSNQTTENVANTVTVSMATNRFLLEPKHDDPLETTPSFDIGVGKTPGLSNECELGQLVNKAREDQSELSLRETSLSEKRIPVKEIVVDTSEDAVLSLSSSRRVPVTAETAATADSSPSLQQGNALYHAARAATRYHEPERHSSSINSMVGNQESLPSVAFERPIDIHAITDNILAASACIADNSVWSDSGRPSVAVDLPASSDHFISWKTSQKQTEQVFRRKRPRPGSGNCPIRLNTYLKERYIAAPAMIFQLTDYPPDDFTLHIFDRQIVHIPWNSPGQQAMSETPCIRTMLRFCYALSAWLHTDSASFGSMSTSMQSMRHSNRPIAIVSCSNGKTRTAIATACYLKYTGIVDNVQSGFCHFLERRCGRETMARTPEAIVADLPASLHTFFRNFDDAVELGGYMNYKPLLLKAIAVQGVPLEDQPCLDLWDASGRHVYSTHPESWPSASDSNLNATSNDTTPYSGSSQWADEEGLFRINRVIQGDFCLLCRFGGVYAADTTDASKLLFRYANSTAFMGAASPYELKYHDVDIQRRYKHYFDDDDFMLTLIFEAHWNVTETWKEILSVNCSDHILQAVLAGVDAKELGWHIIAQHHTAKPKLHDFTKLTTESLGELEGCPDHLLSLALQLANFDYTMAQTILLEGRLRSWWQVPLDDLSVMAKDETFYSGSTILDSADVLSHPESIEKINDILKHVSPNIFQSEKSLSDLPQPKSRMSNVPSITSGSSTLNSERYYIAPIMRPNSGDIVSVLHTSKVSTIFQSSHPSFIADHPIFPVIPRRRRRGAPVPIEHPNNNSATELLLTMDHPGVYLNDLLVLKESLLATTIAPKNISPVSVNTKDSSVTNKHVTNEIPSASKSGDVLDETQNQNSAVEGNPLYEKSLESQNIAESSSTNDIPIKDDPLYQKYFKMKKMGIPEGAVRNAMIKDGVDTKILDLDPEMSCKSQSEAEISINDEIPIKEDPLYQKYFKMKKLGIPDGAVRNTMIKDGIDTKVLDLDPEKSFISQAKVESSATADIPIKDNPLYQKYFKMRKMGLLDGAIRNAMLRDGLDTEILDLDPARSVDSQRVGTVKADDIPIKDDPAYQKYFKMKAMGLPDGAVRNAMIRDGVDVVILDLDPERSLMSQTKPENVTADDIPIKDDPAYQKYFKMKAMGLPDGAVRNAMIRDGVDTDILDLDRERSFESQKCVGTSKANGTPIKDDPAYQKYFKMKKMGLPDGAIRNSMIKDGVDPNILALDAERSFISQTKTDSNVAEDMSIKDNPLYQKYFKMKKMGLSDGAVRNAMIKDGVDTNVLDLDPERSFKSQSKKENNTTDDVPLKDDPVYQKYFKMKKMGLPDGAIRNAIVKDGLNSSVLDLDQNKSLSSQVPTNQNGSNIPLQDDPEWSKYFKMLRMGLPLEAVKNAADKDGNDSSILDLDPTKSIYSQVPVKGTSAPQTNQFMLQKKKKIIMMTIMKRRPR